MISSKALDLFEAIMKIRATEEQDWMILKEIRLAALLDTPTAFGVSYQTAITNNDNQWKQRASSATEPKFWLAFKEEEGIGMIGSGINQKHGFIFINEEKSLDSHPNIRVQTMKWQYNAIS